jgi:hypothetical protein
LSSSRQLQPRILNFFRLLRSVHQMEQQCSFSCFGFRASCPNAAGGLYCSETLAGAATEDGLHNLSQDSTPTRQTHSYLTCSWHSSASLQNLSQNHFIPLSFAFIFKPTVVRKRLRPTRERSQRQRQRGNTHAVILHLGSFRPTPMQQWRR